MNSESARRNLMILAIVAAVIIAAATLYLLFLRQAQAPTVLGTSVQVQASSDYVTLAPLIAAQVNAISPTPATSDIGWIVRTISFVTGQPQAYVEYTDSHLALRMLIEYTYQDSQVIARVLATYEPDEYGSWRLTHGVDQAAGKALAVYSAAGPGKWIRN